MMTLRSDDYAGAAFYNRSDRVFNDGDSGLWYFKTREGTNIGPFRYRTEAEEMLGRFIVGVQSASEKQESSLQKLRFRLSAVPRVA